MVNKEENNIILGALYMKKRALENAIKDTFKNEEQHNARYILMIATKLERVEDMILDITKDGKYDNFICTDTDRLEMNKND